jgi:hypothetical protein
MKLRGPLLVLTLLLASLPAAAQNLDWGMVGSAGVPDNGNSLYATSGPALFIATNAIATMQFRYPVTNTYGSAISKQPGWQTFSMTYSDNHSTGSVTASLMEVDACTATERIVCTLTSNDNDGSTQCDTCSISNIDFATHSYYIDVSVAKTDTPAAPKLYSLALY